LEPAIKPQPHLAALLDQAKAEAAKRAKWQHAWTTGRLDKDFFGKHTQEYTSPPLAPMSRPVLGVVYGLWGGQGEGDSTATPPFTVYVNDTKVGEIAADYSGYGSPGPSITVFDLAAVVDRGVVKVRIVAGSGGHAKLGEVKIYDLTDKDPGEVTPKEKFHGVGYDQPAAQP
jgi:hypothetical protein